MTNRQPGSRPTGIPHLSKVLLGKVDLPDGPAPRPYSIENARWIYRFATIHFREPGDNLIVQTAIVSQHGRREFPI